MVVLPTEKRIDWSRPPVAVFALILLNILIFAIYQSGDENRLSNAYSFYKSEQLNKTEWPAYQDFWERTQAQNYELTLDQLLETDSAHLFQDMVTNPDFAIYIRENDQFYTNDSNVLDQWRLSREKLNAQVNTVSARAYGLTTQNFSIVNLISHQFLHGDIWHLMGNMIFLLVCGFAVEAALGSQRFLTYYLLGGIGAGIIYWLFNASNRETTYLVGASGAISAVMAMYVALFKLKKIEFFYWAFIFVGYFKAPALWILPVYLLTELLYLIFDTQSSVAYSAHIGGFITGFALIFYTQYTNQKAIDENYLDQDQEIDHYREELDRVYKTIANYEFSQALDLTNKMLANHSNDHTLLEIKLNLFKAIGGEKQQDFLVECLSSHGNLSGLNGAWLAYWKSLNEQQQQAFQPKTQAQIAMKLVDANEPLLSEKIFEHLATLKFLDPALAKLARRLSHYYEREGFPNKKVRYDEYADELTRNL